MTRKTYKWLTPREFKDIKELIAQNPHMKLGELKRQTGRAGATLGFIKRANSFHEYRAILQAWSREHRVKKNSQGETTLEKPINTLQKESLDQAVYIVEKNFEALKESIENAIVIGAEDRVKRYRVSLQKELEEKDEKIKDLEIIVDAAKGHNLASILKKRLMGSD